ncbi:VCBS repeat-containing protein [Sphaerisporangium sp. NPDC051011]|uniref:FG-GAP repeat domain-containing protein n=1 Tax=Sphaerisporangium sp. NPDC051011 TaxID=3155792 RepID=UPI0033D8D253
MAEGTGNPGSKVRFADVDADRDADYLVVGDNGDVSLWRNNDVTTGGSWGPQVKYVSDLNSAGRVEFADIDGDKDADYLVVSPGGVVTAWRNDKVASVGGSGWHKLGMIADGVEMFSSERVTFADYDGDGDDDDYLVVSDAGKVRAWRNDGASPLQGGGWAWKSVGTIATGSTSEGEVQFADIDGDGADGYLAVVGHKAYAWRNHGTNAPGGGGWGPKTQIADPSQASASEKTMFAHIISCDGRADYILRDPTQNNKLTGWKNLAGFANRWDAAKKVAYGWPSVSTPRSTWPTSPATALTTT